MKRHKKELIRRYYGHDCNSVDGFNNGYYFDDEFRISKDPLKDCLSLLKNLWDIRDKKDLTELDNGYELITGYSDKDGND